jgi:hypothetical protein
MKSETQIRERIVEIGRSLYAPSLSPGSSIPRLGPFPGRY